MTEVWAGDRAGETGSGWFKVSVVLPSSGWKEIKIKIKKNFPFVAATKCHRKSREAGTHVPAKLSACQVPTYMKVAHPPPPAAPASHPMVAYRTACPSHKATLTDSETLKSSFFFPDDKNTPIVEKNGEVEEHE